jgi:hypothetical protein
MYCGQMELNFIWENWTGCYQLYQREILFYHPILLYFSKLGLDPSVACGPFVIFPSYFGLYWALLGFIGLIGLYWALLGFFK